MLSRSAALALAALALTSCQESFLVTPHVMKDGVTISFAEDYTIYKKSFSPCLTRVAVYLIRPSAQPVKIWDIRPHQSQCVRVKEFRFGAVPNGFAQHGPLLPITLGGRYIVEASEHTHRDGVGEFRMAN